MFWENLTMAVVLMSQSAYEELHWPKPTKEMTNLVEDMGHDRFVVREKAHRQLGDMGFKSILAVRRGMSHKDIEIRMRCKRIFKGYFNLSPTKGDYEPIFKIKYGTNLKRVWGKGTVKITEEIAKSYYLKQWEMDRPVEIVVYYDETVARKATSLYAADLLRQGVDKEVLIRAIDGMAGAELSIPADIQNNRH